MVHPLMGGRVVQAETLVLVFLSCFTSKLSSPADDGVLCGPTRYSHEPSSVRVSSDSNLHQAVKNQCMAERTGSPRPVGKQV